MVPVAHWRLNRHNSPMNATSIKRYAWLSIATAIATILLKAAAWRMTGSIGLLSDALESIVNLAGAMMALAMISLAEQPADERHAYGHGKAEYFSAGFEGLLILIAALAIGFTAVERLFDPHPLERVGVGLAGEQVDWTGDDGEVRHAHAVVAVRLPPPRLVVAHPHRAPRQNVRSEP